MKTYMKVLSGVLAFAVVGVFAGMAQEKACPTATDCKAVCGDKATCCKDGKLCEKHAAACAAKTEACPAPAAKDAAKAVCNPERCKKCMDPAVKAKDCCCEKNKAKKEKAKKGKEKKSE